MVWSRKYLHFARKYSKVLGVSSIAVIGFAVYDRIKKRGVVHASWTTNYEPSVKWDANWDRREPESLIKPLKRGVPIQKDTKDYENELLKKTPTASRHLILIRHGQYNTNGDDDKERILTALGREQAEHCGKRLRDLNCPYTVLISSTMARAVETAGIIHKHLPDLPWEKCELLCEGAPIPPEPPHGSWRPEKQQFFEDGARIEAAFRKYFHRADPNQTSDSFEIIVCHANVIRYFVCRALQFPPEAWLRIGLNHCSLTMVTIRPNGRVALKSLGDSGFIPVDKVSAL